MGFRFSTTILLTSLALASLGCGDDDSASAPVTVDAGADLVVGACAPVVLDGNVTGSPADARWSAAGVPLLLLDERRGDDVAFTAPSVAAETTLLLELRAETRDGVVVTDTAEVRVTAADPDADLAAGMARGCAPFTAGVASGDPLPHGIVLWTYVDDPAITTLRWQVATDALFRDIAAEDDTAVGVDSGTVHVEVDRLTPGTTYFYRFQTPAGVFSELGRTQTAPTGEAEVANFAVASCSSIYSGHFNAYRRIAEREELDLVIHLGDYLYDFVDENEQIRIPEPYPQEPQNLDAWRARHEYYLADPDLRFARAMHPWFMLWDNHDVEAGAAPDYNGSVQAFREWNPMRQPVPGRPELAYRQLRWGTLVDLFAVDILLFRNRDRVPGSDAFGILGDEQWAWLEPSIEQSTATWRLLGMQKPFGQLRINRAFAAALGEEPRDFFDLGTWDGFPEDRARLLDLLDDHDLVDNLFLSGDSHISIALNIVDDFDMPTRALGAEMLPTSISRGNFDEQLGSLASPQLINFLINDTLGRNPHGVYLELVKHGYGTLAITPAAIRATYWYSDILLPTMVEEEGPSFLLERGIGEWAPG